MLCQRPNHFGCLRSSIIYTQNPASNVLNFRHWQVSMPQVRQRIVTRAHGEEAEAGEPETYDRGAEEQGARGGSANMIRSSGGSSATRMREAAWG
jgi:hypothetical protein